MDAAGRQRPDGRAHKRPFAAKKTGGSGDIDMQAFRPLGILESHDRRKPPAVAGQFLERHSIGRRIVVIDLGHMAGPRAMGQRQHGHPLGQRHARRDLRRRIRSPMPRPVFVIAARRRCPRPRHHRHHAAPLAPADKHRRPAQPGLLEQPSLHRPPRQPDRHDARHATASAACTACGRNIRMPPASCPRAWPPRDEQHPRDRSIPISTARPSTH